MTEPESERASGGSKLSLSTAEEQFPDIRASLPAVAKEFGV
jgi:hypothetical protein